MTRRVRRFAPVQCSMKRLGALLLPLDRVVVDHKVTRLIFVSSLVLFFFKYTPRLRGTKWNIVSCLRGRLHGEFQPGLKFQPAHRAEILLRLHG